MKLALSAVVVSLTACAAKKPDGTCGYQCKADADCGGCGSSGAGHCSCPDGVEIAFSATSCSCVAAPKDAPSSPEASIEDSVWPAKWTADVDSWTYGDFTDKTAEAHGKFYYDSVLQRSRADWHPYINGKDAKQVWIADVANNTSKYFVKFGPLCISFAITDPGQGKSLVGLEKADWMKRCKEGGWAKYIGREQVLVGDKEEWVDHWSCRLDYQAANQSITFQNWHSLGLGAIPKGMPIRVTGGNSAPDPQKGSPRLNTVWYSNFVTGDSATKADDFVKPNFGACIPVGEEEVQKHFGHRVTKDHAFSADFHRRAHFLPHAKPNSRDLIRAKRRTPGPAFRGDSFRETMQKLNKMLVKERGLKTMPCSNFTAADLHSAQRLLFDARTSHLDSVYRAVGDTRRMAHSSLDELQKEQRAHTQLEAESPKLAEKARDGACHEAVMWYVHHLTAEAKEEIKQNLLLPLLPEMQHGEPASQDAAAQRVHARYTDQVSCAVCHVTPAGESMTITV